MREAAITNASVLLIEPLSPPPQNTPASLIASRFKDTWTKLRVFELHKYGYEKLVFLDADMLVLQNMDELFEVNLPGKDWIAANHACVCNLDSDSWAPDNWTRNNCAYTDLMSTSIATPVPIVGPDEGIDAWSEPHRLLNSGLFIFTPHQSQWEQILSFLGTDERLKHFLFPDQDFLAAYFLDRWKSIGWQYNALKTMRYWHAHMWDENEVKNLHYIVDKPWTKRVGYDGVAGYLGHDGITHSWWWKAYEKWETEREKMGEGEILEMIRKEVAQPLVEN
jgi:inositol 3-alpha-galactosyltransferase